MAFSYLLRCGYYNPIGFFSLHFGVEEESMPNNQCQKKITVSLIFSQPLRNESKAQGITAA